MSSIEFRNIRKSFGAVEALGGIDLEIPDGAFCVFLGPSGCGKTTLMRVLAGLEMQTSGDVVVAGAVVNEATPSERGVGMVFQSYALYPHMNVRENLRFPLKMSDQTKDVSDRRIDEVARILQVEHLLDRRPSQLSGGQKQRVAIGRTIALDRSVFLFDEPLSNLDADLRVEMRLELQRLHKRLKSTMVYVTHDQIEAMALADMIVIMRGGVIEQVGTPDALYSTPDNLFVATFLGSPKMNVLKATVVEASGGSARFRLSSGDEITVRRDVRTRAGQEVSLCIRPEDLSVAPDDIALPLDVEMTEFLGPNGYAYGTSGADKLTIQLVRRNGRFDLPQGKVHASTDAIHIFGEDGTRLVDRVHAPKGEVA